MIWDSLRYGLKSNLRSLFLWFSDRKGYCRPSAILAEGGGGATLALALALPSVASDNLIYIGHNCNKYVFKYLTQIFIYDSLI
jgi:hypothetical protein